MHLTRQSCRGVPSKDHYVGKGLLVGLLLLVLVSAALAWNKPGHMVAGAIAYADLKQTRPQTLTQVVALLKTHPHFETTWKPQLNQSFVAADERDLYLFMLAARWPDDIRGDTAFHHGTWHYINFPYKPEGQPASVQTAEPLPENVVSAYQANLDIVRGTTPGDRAVALCWLFHLIGDVHQPLHTVALFTTQFPAPEGDRGGTRFYIRVTPTTRTTISLHEFWDDLILGSERFQSVRNRATALRLQPEHARAQLPELQETSLEQWARQESFSLATAQAYRNGQLQGSNDKEHGEVLPADYIATVKPLAERRVVLAGYRLADVLTEIAGAAQETPVRGNKKSKIYHLPDCPGFAAVSPANIVTFASAAAAEHAGYRKAKNCP
jgi:S1/P1 Nuclease/Metal binding domain of Ada